MMNIMIIWKYKNNKKTLKVQPKYWPFFHLVQLSARFLQQRGDHFTQMRADFVYQFSMMLLHALVDFTKQIEMLIRDYE